MIHIFLEPKTKNTIKLEQENIIRKQTETDPPYLNILANKQICL